MKRILAICAALVLSHTTAQVSLAREDGGKRIVDVRSERSGVVYFIGAEYRFAWRIPPVMPPGFIEVELGGEKRIFLPIKKGENSDNALLVLVAPDLAVERELKEGEVKWRDALDRERSEQASIRKIRLGEILLNNNPYPAGTTEYDQFHANWLQVIRSQKKVLEEHNKNPEDAVQSKREVQRYGEVLSKLANNPMSSIGGRVTHIFVKPGQVVRAGDIIMQVEVDMPKIYPLR